MKKQFPGNVFAGICVIAVMSLAGFGSAYSQPKPEESEKEKLLAILDAMKPAAALEDIVTDLQKKMAPVVGAGIQFARENDDRIVIVRVMKGKPADAAGMQAGDIVLSLNGTDFTNSPNEKFVAEIRGDAKPGRTITFELLRNKEKISLLVTTAVLRPDRTAEVNQFVTALREEGNRYLATVETAIAALREAVHSGVVTIADFRDENPKPDPRLMAASNAVDFFYDWLDGKQEEADKVVALE